MREGINTTPTLYIYNIYVNTYIYRFYIVCLYIYNILFFSINFTHMFTCILSCRCRMYLCCIHLCVCKYFYVYVFCVHECIRINIYIIYIYIYLYCLHVCFYNVCMYVCFFNIHIACIHTCQYTHIYTHMEKNIFILICTNLSKDSRGNEAGCRN